MPAESAPERTPEKNNSGEATSDELASAEADPEALTAMLGDIMPLCRTLGIVVQRLDQDAAVLSLPWAERLCTTNGLMHGGTIMALADTAGGALAASNLPEDASGTSTIESKTNFLGAVTDGEAVATARVLHKGRTTIVIETEIRNGDRLVAKVTQTQVVLRPRSG